MSEIELRPRFTLKYSESKEILIERLRASLSTSKEEIHGRTLDYHGTLLLPENEISFWSPQLDIEIEDNEEDEGSTVRGLFGPRPSLWLLFMFIYITLGTASLFAIIIGFSELSTGDPLIGFYVCPIFLGAILTMHFVAKYGQKKMRHQIKELYFFLTNSLDKTA